MTDRPDIVTTPLPARIIEAADALAGAGQSASGVALAALLREAAQENTNLHKANVTLNGLYEKALEHMQGWENDAITYRQERDALRAQVEAACEALAQMMNEHTPLGQHANGEIEYCALPACLYAAEVLRALSASEKEEVAKS